MLIVLCVVSLKDDCDGVVLIGVVVLQQGGVSLLRQHHPDQWKETPQKESPGNACLRGRNASPVCVHLCVFT